MIFTSCNPQICTHNYDYCHLVCTRLVLFNFDLAHLAICHADHRSATFTGILLLSTLQLGLCNLDCCYSHKLAVNLTWNTPEKWCREQTKTTSKTCWNRFKYASKLHWNRPLNLVKTVLRIGLKTGLNCLRTSLRTGLNSPQNMPQARPYCLGFSLPQNNLDALKFSFGQTSDFP